ncbi:hypothetical protein BP6252_08800 [Coleophoma cylindrospora]|uniref:Alternative oxidase n=1 Tax=Coleophoma cylindrospora TaxID=1849047 RepID=A0A3D8R775_9HELO|nr:hypothetical protein BP6252_08800 [Coleophoma cylindrospora]
MAIRKLSAHINRRYSSLAGITFAVICICFMFDVLYVFPRSVIKIGSAHGSKTTSGVSAPDIFDFAPIQSESIKSICSATEWNTSVVFTCDNSVGGVGNIRNSILNCVRYAISAGGGLVLPKIIVRSNEDIAKIRTGERTNMDYMFDTTHFVKSLRLSCPQLRLFKTVNDVRNGRNGPGLMALHPESLIENIPKYGLTHPEQWRATFYDWLERSSWDNRGERMVIELARSYLQYPIYSDGEGFALAFGDILKFRSDVRILATKTLLNLFETFPVSIDPARATLRDGFFGAHLRTEKDAQEGWPAQDWEFSKYETQSRLYIEQAARSTAPVIYVASGDREQVARFAQDVKVINKTVTTKFDLLKAEDMRYLSALAWDQQALVDFLVMLKASDFAGVGHSSFAWNIALKRHILAGTRKYLDGPQMLSDEFSQIYGKPRGYPEYASCLWP